MADIQSSTAVTFFFSIILPSPAMQVYTQAPVLQAQVLRVACWAQVLAAQRREGRVGLHRDRRLSNKGSQR